MEEGSHAGDAAKVDALMEVLGMTQKQLARECGCDRTCLSRWLRGMQTQWQSVITAGEAAMRWREANKARTPVGRDSDGKDGRHEDEGVDVECKGTCNEGGGDIHAASGEAPEHAWSAGPIRTKASFDLLPWRSSQNATGYKGVRRDKRGWYSAIIHTGEMEPGRKCMVVNTCMCLVYIYTDEMEPGRKCMVVQ